MGAFLAGKRIVVTGGAGFLGQHVCRELEQYHPAELIVPRSATCDLREKEAIRALFLRHRPQVIVHLAAVVGGLGANRQNPGRYFYENAIMGLQLMEQARLAGVEKFVSVGTVCSYPDTAELPYREEQLWSGYPETTNAPYGLAKRMLIVQGQAYRAQYDFPAISLLLANLYGPGDNFDPETSHVIPALIRKAVEARESGRACLDVWGNGTASRDFLFVRDAAEAVALAAETYHNPDPVNIGSGHEISICELATWILELTRFPGEIRWDASQTGGQQRRCLETRRAERELGFRATTPFRDGLRETVDWFERNRDGASAQSHYHRIV